MRPSPVVQIVLVEDNPGDVLLVRHSLENLDLKFDLTCYSDEPEALGQLGHWERNPPDAILLDLSMPRGEGFTILKEIRQSPVLRQTPVIILSSSDSPSDKAEATALKADRFVPKPCDLDEFVTQISSAVMNLLHRTPAQSGVGAS